MQTCIVGSSQNNDSYLALEIKSKGTAIWKMEVHTSTFTQIFVMCWEHAHQWLNCTRASNIVLTVPFMHVHLSNHLME